MEQQGFSSGKLCLMGVGDWVRVEAFLAVMTGSRMLVTCSRMLLHIHSIRGEVGCSPKGPGMFSAHTCLRATVKDMPSPALQVPTWPSATFTGVL